VPARCLRPTAPLWLMNGACRSALQYAENETVIFSDTGAPGAVTNMFFGGQFDLPGAKTGGVGYRESVRACLRPTS